MNEFQENLLENYKNPKNYGDPIFDVTASAKEDNLTCGDSIEVFLEIENDKLSNISFKAEGCSISIGTMSILSEELKEMSLGNIKELEYNDIQKLIQIELTPSRIRCATLGLEAIQKALNEL
jgi:nitrogen fixation NifU-like protein